jgi:Rrf2 family transcriptional regulator, cysteine metabolism repressor
MKLSTKTRYGIRAMLELALNYKRKPLSIKEIAKNQEISKKYLEHLLILLKTAGLVGSTRGAGGGYALTRPPSEIRLSQIVQVLEGSLSLVDCVDSPVICSRSKFCATRDVWFLIKQSIVQVLYSITLDGLLKRQEKKSGDKPLVYNI